MPVNSPIFPGDGDSRHGTVTGYKNHQCRCDLCRRSWADYSRGWMAADPLRKKKHRFANRQVVPEPEPDLDEEPYVFSRPPVKRIETTAEVRLSRQDEPLLPWMTERLVVLDYNPEVAAFYEGETLVVRVCLALMPVEAEVPGWADQVVAEAVEWAKGDPRLVR